jgi:hypothetical protein
MKRLLTIVFACFLTHQTIEAAEISIVSPETPEHPAIIMIKGMLMNEDYHFHEDVTLFSNVADRQKNAIVFLEGPGGKLRTALEIGLAINQRGFSTAVADGAMCNSSCALVWLGGKERFMGKDAIIGFHAASGIPAKPGESPKISSVGNAMAGAYMAQVGIKDLLTVAFLTRAPPGSNGAARPLQGGQLPHSRQSVQLFTGRMVVGEPSISCKDRTSRCSNHGNGRRNDWTRHSMALS